MAKKFLSNQVVRYFLLTSYIFTCCCSEEYGDEAHESVFSEIGEPILDDNRIKQDDEPQLSYPEEEGSEKKVDSKVLESEKAEVVEGEIQFGQAITASDYNESLTVMNNLPPHDPKSKYKALSYSELTDFSYEIEWESDGLEFDFAAYSNRVPRGIRSLSGKTIALEGFMVPTVVDEENRVKEFLLMPDQLSCCFGQAPEANGWVVARSEEGVDVAMDRVIRVLGTLTVQERWDEEFFVGLYHIECDEMIHDDH